MKSLVRVFAWVAVVAFVGCATLSSSGTPSSNGPGSKLNDADFKRMGVSETYEKRN